MKQSQCHRFPVDRPHQHAEKITSSTRFLRKVGSTCPDFHQIDRKERQAGQKFVSGIARGDRQATGTAASSQHNPAQHRNIVARLDWNVAVGAHGRPDPGESPWEPVGDDIQKTADRTTDGKKPTPDQHIEGARQPHCLNHFRGLFPLGQSHQGDCVQSSPDRQDQDR